MVISEVEKDMRDSDWRDKDDRFFGEFPFFVAMLPWKVRRES